jgi:hypothetical protein
MRLHMIFTKRGTKHEMWQDVTIRWVQMWVHKGNMSTPDREFYGNGDIYTLKWRIQSFHGTEMQVNLSKSVPWKHTKGEKSIAPTIFNLGARWRQEPWVNRWQSFSWSRHSHILWNPKFHYRVHNTDIAFWADADRPHLSKIQINKIFPSMARSPKWHLPFMTRDYN